MEFYLTKPYKCSKMHSFNSQRDGILPEQDAINALVGECFNSQRDGILRLLFALSLLHEAVSIPNGMEFYNCKCPRNRAKNTIVSILNGMEFYLAAIEAAFRKQRVSIPNGMEFYARARSNGA